MSRSPASAASSMAHVLASPRARPRAAADRLSIAPMMEWTTSHFRFLARLLTRRTLLYTEMFVDNTLLFSPHAAEMLRFHPAEHPVACQLGGCNPVTLARAAALAERAGYDEVNLNCGCPSAKVAGSGAFGARLMFTPELVRDCVAAMRAAVTIPVTVKCRLGADDMDSYEAFAGFLDTVAQGGCEHFIVHARKCLLKGLSPKDNRTIPPLRYDWVQRASLQFPHLRISLNGGVPDVPAALRLLALRRGPKPEGGAEEAVGAGEGQGAGAGAGDEARSAVGGAAEDGSGDAAADGGADCRSCCDAGAGAEGAPPATAPPAPPPWALYEGCHEPRLPPAPEALCGDEGVLASVMIGRAAYANPWLLATADSSLWGQPDPGLTRRQVTTAYLDYCCELLREHAEAAAEPGAGGGAGAGAGADSGAGAEATATARPLVGMLRPFEMAKPLLGLFHGCVGGGRFRALLTVAIQGGDKGIGKRLGIREAVEAALEAVPAHVLDERPGALRELEGGERGRGA